MNITFIGGGNMASAMIGGLLGRGFFPEQICVVEINADSRAKLYRDYSIQSVDNLVEGEDGSQVIVFAVKPQQLRDIAQRLGPLLHGQLLISIAAGIRAADIARWANHPAVVRAMPNTPALIRSGMSGLYALPAVGTVQCGQAQDILSAVGETIWLQDEAMLDAVTAISGSGPAYFFYFIEALEQAGKELGLSEQMARKLALETALGAAKLAHDSTESPAMLRARVTSKNGTTERALLSMEANHVKQHIIDAAHAAAKRSREMGEELGRD